MESLIIQNIYQENLLKILIFMCLVKSYLIPAIFKIAFNFPVHQYLTGFASSNFVKLKINLAQSKFRISVRRFMRMEFSVTMKKTSKCTFI